MEHDFYVKALIVGKVFSGRCKAAREMMESRGGLEALFSSGIAHLGDDSMRRWAEKELEWAVRNDVKILYIDDPGYPKRLRECPDAPIVLFYKGCANLDADKVLAVVGTRRCTYNGRQNCINLLRELKEDGNSPLVVSGLAYGIDAAAHETALELGLQTVAVIPTGLDTIYPSRHRALADRILEQGAVVTDFTKNTFPQTFTFCQRNRIIAGLSDATLLVESFAKGGGLITTSLANSYDRDVFAVPGRLSDASYAGCNSLIEKDIAHIVTGASSIEKVMGWHSPDKKAQTCSLFREDDSPLARQILKLLQWKSPMANEELCSRIGLPVQEMAPELLILELDRRIVSLQGRKYALP